MLKRGERITTKRFHKLSELAGRSMLPSKFMRYNKYIFYPENLEVPKNPDFEIALESDESFTWLQIVEFEICNDIPVDEGEDYPRMVTRIVEYRPKDKKEIEKFWRYYSYMLLVSEE